MPSVRTSVRSCASVATSAAERSFEITYRGKPVASLTALSENDLEDFVLEHSRKSRKKLAEAEADRKAGRVLPLEAYIAGSRSRRRHR